tara:strand:- start:107 stop:334 length:228 start_codon:yes stop_codon:yes gene_type:complete
MTSKDINRGDIVFQISSGRLGIITESSVRVDKENTNQIEFDWYASVLWFANKMNNKNPLGKEYALLSSLNLVSKA